jgi:hypothetical protein
VDRGSAVYTPADLLWDLTLVDALAVLVLIARRDPKRYPRAAARWLERWLAETAGAGIDEAALVLGALVALRGGDHRRAADILAASAKLDGRRPTVS